MGRPGPTTHSAPIRYLGPVDDLSDLPASGAEVGDAYYVVSEQQIYIYDRTSYDPPDSAPLWRYSGETIFAIPKDVVALIGREGEPALLEQAKIVIAVVSAQINEWYGPWLVASDVTLTVRGTNAAALFPGITYSKVKSVTSVDDGTVLDPSGYSHHGAAIFRTGGWGGHFKQWTIVGNVERQPSPAVRSVVQAVCARMLLNPTWNDSSAVEGTSVAGTVGLTLYEERILQRWRLTSTWPRGNP